MTKRQEQDGAAELNPVGAERLQRQSRGARSHRGARVWAVSAVAVVHCVAFSAAAVALPWRDYTSFALLTAAVAVGHALTVVSCLAKHPWFERVWRFTSWLALVWLGVLSVSIATSAVYMARIYGALGSGIAIALLIGWCIPILFTLPFASWALASTPKLRGRGQLDASQSKGHAPTRAAVLLLTFSLVGLSWQRWAGASTRPTGAKPITKLDLKQLVLAELPPYARLPKPPRPPVALSLEPYGCSQPVSGAAVTLFVQYNQRNKPQLAARRCLQGETAREVFRQAGLLIEKQASKAPIKLDLVTEWGQLSSTDPLLDGFKLRPALDGICDEKQCLLGWQLMARHMLNEHTPISAIPELRMGFSAHKVRAALGSTEAASLDGLQRIVSISLLHADTTTVLTRMHREEQAINRTAVARADRLAEQHVIRALQEDGRYRYQLDPFTGQSDVEGYNLPRQAGTTLVLCELGSFAATVHARAALEQMARLEVRSGEKSVLLPDGSAHTASLGHQALPLIAFLTCRDRVGKEFDPLIGRLARTVLALQRPRGDFYPAWDLQRYEPQPGSPPLFSPGQAVMSLVLLEKVLLSKRPRLFPKREKVRAAVAEAMHYYGEKYWDFPLGKLFYVEENWHCLAARAALGHHRISSYERFCIEHAEFKARFIIGEESPTRDMQGAFALAPLIPPPNTATAGVGEALAAAIQLKKARGEDTAWAEAQLSKLIGFLLRQQWDAETCFACPEVQPVVGGFSDSMLTPTLRIDFTQHAWAAISHGAAELGLGPRPQVL